MGGGSLSLCMQGWLAVIIPSSKKKNSVNQGAKKKQAMFENLKKKKKINREQQSKHTISLHKSAIHPYPELCLHFWPLKKLNFCHKIKSMEELVRNSFRTGSNYIKLGSSGNETMEGRICNSVYDREGQRGTTFTV